MAVRAARTDIDAFLDSRRVALIGVSRARAHFSRLVWNAFRERGYDTVLVHPEAAEIEGAGCARNVGDIHPPPGAALILLPSVQAAAAAEQCASAGIGRIWTYRPIDAAPLRARGVSVVSGECPMMFLPGAGGIHRIHGWVRQIVGSYPE